MADPIRKTSIHLTAVYKNGDVLVMDHRVPAVASVREIPKAPTKYRELNIRVVVDSRDAEQLLEGFLRGQVYLDIEQMIPAVDRQ